MKARTRQGFTLVELIVMMTVIAILVAVAVPNFSGAQDRSRNSGIQHNLHLIQQSIEEYGSEINHQFPEDLAAEFIGKGNNYLPSDNYPPTPWNKQQKQTIKYKAGDVVTKEPYEYKCGTDCEGKIEDPVSTRSYGVIIWGIGADGLATGRSQAYRLAGNGKKGRNVLRVLTIGNNMGDL
ncbi:MAG: type II secretion system protein [Candidatus Sericytochromatia bacterium]|nr:type II secretion system protein [Candidatus Tanganyikabacteria bacterium]